MAVTPYPQDLLHVGAAKPLNLDTGLSIPASGNITLSVAGSASAKGWPAIPAGRKMVITVGRGTQYEAKYLVSTITSGTTSSTLTVLAADRNYDGTLPLDAPAGTLVEHTISGAEMEAVNAHMRSASAHGIDGAFVDTASEQTLSGKKFIGATVLDYLDIGAGGASKCRVLRADGYTLVLRPDINGDGTFDTGQEFYHSATDGWGVETPLTLPGAPTLPNHAANKGYADALVPAWSAWTPSFSGGSNTFGVIAPDRSLFVRVGPAQGGTVFWRTAFGYTGSGGNIWINNLPAPAYLGNGSQIGRWQVVNASGATASGDVVGGSSQTSGKLYASGAFYNMPPNGQVYVYGFYQCGTNPVDPPSPPFVP